MFKKLNKMDSDDNRLSKKIYKNNFYISLGLNIFVIIALIIVIVLGSTLSSTHDSYISFGPSNSLVVFSIAINTAGKYVTLAVSLMVYASIDVFISNTTNNEMWNNIYSTSVVRIYNYKNEYSLMFSAQFISLCNSLRAALAVKLMVTQIDLVLIILLTSWAVNFFPIYLSLENKCFGPEDGLPNNGRGCERHYRKKEEEKIARQKEFSQYVEAARKTQVFVPPRI